MRTVRINKGELVEKLTANRKNHRSQFELAFEGYRKECIQLLTDSLNLLKQGRNIAVKFYEQAPEDHTGDYDTVLNMLSMSADSVIELTQDEFRQYVEDNWRWREHWAASNLKYISR